MTSLFAFWEGKLLHIVGRIDTDDENKLKSLCESASHHMSFVIFYWQGYERFKRGGDTITTVDLCHRCYGLLLSSSDPHK